VEILESQNLSKIYRIRKEYVFVAIRQKNDQISWTVNFSFEQPIIIYGSDLTKSYLENVLPAVYSFLEKKIYTQEEYISQIETFGFTNF
jgi:hypothetical protein